jgi:ADP-ribose pyrophosphatase YjhB (NUDIX family)
MGHIHELIDFIVNIYIINNDKILMIKHKSLGIWLPVGGHIEPNEDPEEALYREVKEECGLEIELVNKTYGISDDECKFLPVPNFLDIHNISDKHKHIAFEYVAIAKSNIVKFNKEEHDEIKWFSEEKIDKLELKNNVRFMAKEAFKIARNL